MVACVTSLTVSAWCIGVAPRLIWWRLRGRPRLSRCYAFETTRLAWVIARASRIATGVRVERFPHRLSDILDEDGLRLRWKIAFHELTTVQREIMQEPAFGEAVRRARHDESRWPMFLAKALVPVGFGADHDALWRALLAIQALAWFARRQPGPAPRSFLFLQARPWMALIARYAARDGVAVVAVPPPWQPRTWLLRRVPLAVRRRLRSARAVWTSWRVHRSVKAGVLRNGPHAGPRIGVDSYGQFNLFHPERYSDLFFWQQASLPGRDLVLYFNLPQDPLDEAKQTQLREQGIDALVLNPLATTVPDAPQWRPRTAARRRRPAERIRGRDHTLEARWLREHRDRYDALRQDWREIFAATGVKIYVTWFKYGNAHCAIADALQELGGVAAIYQRAYELHPSVQLTVTSDLVFGFSRVSAEVARASGSRIKYHVTTGYLGDHRFALLREQARGIRRTLEQRGATRLLALADENTLSNGQWNLGHEFMRPHYAFVLEKILAEPWLGVVIKPKVASTLHQRLGPVAALLRRAEATGRCVILEGGALHNGIPPAAAALAADVMVHTHLRAATAGVESALAGVPTLLLDSEGWPKSPLYRLGVGRVVFRDLETLWAACLDHWQRPGGVAGFGDWSPSLELFDPFRDGRAAERMGTYLRWMLDGFKAGHPRETVLADAAERYAAQWGRDKVEEVSPTDAAERRARWGTDKIVPAAAAMDTPPLMEHAERGGQHST